MEDYLDFAPTSSMAAARRLHLVALLDTREPHTTARDLALEHGISRGHLYALRARARHALKDHKPGPDTHKNNLKRLQEKVEVLESELAAAEKTIKELNDALKEAVHVDQRRRDQLELLCLGHHVSIRATQDIITVAWGQDFTPSTGAIAKRRIQHGQRARDLIDKARAQVRDQIVCVMADDVYFHQQDIKVIAEPHSMAVLNLGHWEGCSGLDWVVWLEEFSNLKLLTSDLAKDLVGAGTTLDIAHCADFFHEVRWWKDKVLKPLLKAEKKAHVAWWRALDRATRPKGPGRRLREDTVQKLWRAWDQTETDYLVLAVLFDEVVQLFEPVNRATGRLWRAVEQDALLDALLSKLSKLSLPSARRAEKHLRSHRSRYTAWRVMFDALAASVVSDSWSGLSVLNGLLRLWRLKRSLQDGSIWSGFSAYQSGVREARALECRLVGSCSNLVEIASRLKRELCRPRRSSSGVESFNSRLRVAQQVHRHVSDEHLSVLALRWNLTPRPAGGPRAGQRPYDLLGVDIGQGNKPWFDVLLDAA